MTIAEPESSASILRVEGLRTYLFLRRGVVRAVDDVNLDVSKGEVVGVVGESGSGKSMLAQSLLGLVPSGIGRVVGGTVSVGGRVVDPNSRTDMRGVRGRRIAIVFQDSSTALNPFFTVRSQLGSVLRSTIGRRPEDSMLERALADVGISAPAQRLGQYPHQLSGGIRQRVAIAMALALRPELLIADEPTTALDVTVQRQIIQLLRSIQRSRDMALMFITHDLELAGEICDRVFVMYAGRIVESGDVGDVLGAPQHPYTMGLVDCIVKVSDERQTLKSIEGSPPDPLQRPTGCAFHPRCPHAMERCRQEYPPSFRLSNDREVACWLKNPS